MKWFFIIPAAIILFFVIKSFVKSWDMGFLKNLIPFIAVVGLVAGLILGTSPMKEYYRPMVNPWGWWLLALVVLTGAAISIPSLDKGWKTAAMGIFIAATLLFIAWPHIPGLGKEKDAQEWSDLIILEEGDRIWFSRDGIVEGGVDPGEEFKVGDVIVLDVISGTVIQGGVPLNYKNFNRIPINAAGYVPIDGAEGGGDFRWRWVEEKEEKEEN